MPRRTEGQLIWDALHGNLEGIDLERIRQEHPAVREFLDQGRSIKDELSPEEYQAMALRLGVFEHEFEEAPRVDISEGLAPLSKPIPEFKEKPVVGRLKPVGKSEVRVTAPRVPDGVPETPTGKTEIVTEIPAPTVSTEVTPPSTELPSPVIPQGRLRRIQPIGKLRKVNETKALPEE